jgi:FkbM family methyltransferase
MVGLKANVKNKNVITNSDHGLLLINRNDRYIGASISAMGSWELQYIDLLKELITKFYTPNSSIEIIDAGANIGVYSIAMSKIDGFSVKIIAIEAQRLIFQMLNANIALNSLENVWTYHRVILDKNAQAILLECPNLNIPANFGAYEIRKDLANSDYDGKIFMPAEEVQSITLDSLELENCVLIKLDIEGMEDVGLIGSMNLIKKSKPIIFFERHKTDYNKAKSVLKECGYAIWELPEGNVLALRNEWDAQFNDFVRIDL